MQDFANAVVAAIHARTAMPPTPAELSIDGAYEVQAAVAAQLASEGGIAGLKAGMTNAVAQKQFGIDAPLLAVLFDQGRLESGASFAQEPSVSIELEVGVVLAADGKTAEALQPAIELPRIAFGPDNPATGPGLVSCCIASDRYIVGEKCAVTDVSSLTATLTRDGKEVVVGEGVNANGGPMLSFDWMLGEAQRVGRATAGGMLCITGAMGPVIPAEPGAYVADFGPLGKIEFTVT